MANNGASIEMHRTLANMGKLAQRYPGQSMYFQSSTEVTLSTGV